MPAKARIGLGLLAAIVAVGGGIHAWRSARKRVAAEDTIAIAQRDQRAAAAEIRDLDARLAKLGRESAEQAKQAGSPVGATVLYASRPMAKKQASPAPAVVAAALRRFKAGLALAYAGFYHQAGLSPAQIVHLEEILTEHEGRNRDVRATRAEQKLRADDSAIATLEREEDARFEAALREALGETAKRLFDDYRAGLPDRRIVGEFVGQLALSDAPLAPAQTQALAAIVREYRGADSLQDPARWAAIVARAQPILQPQQFAEFQFYVRTLQQPEVAELRRIVEDASAK